MGQETWKIIPNTGGRYLASTFGRIKGTLRGDRILSQGNKGNGYAFVNIWAPGQKVRAITVHRLIAITFLPNPEDKPTVNHKDGNKANNNVSNLEWSTRKENTQHSVRTLLHPCGSKNKQAKLSEADVKHIKDSVASGEKQVRLAERFNVNPRVIYDIVHGHKWKHVS